MNPLFFGGKISPENNISDSSNRKPKYVTIAFALAIFLLFGYLLFLSPPTDFPVGAIFKIKEGGNLHSVSSDLKAQHIIRSRAAFEAFVILYGAELHINYSDYLFENKLPVYEIARRISKGEHHLAPIAVTIPEGFDNSHIADTFALKLPDFTKTKFLLEAKTKEGYLFPDTYFFFTSASEESVISSMNENFKRKIALIRPLINNAAKKFNRSEKEIVIMASIIEGESSGEADREFISGILWKRLELGMPLQVDAAPETYRIKGLPQNPIGNPGLSALKAAASPKNSPYLYYLHDKEGNIHYARTFAEHVNNKFKYLE